jgi:GTP-binding protein HflX
LLVGAPLKRPGARRLADEHLRELADLADTAGAIVAGELLQQIDRPNPGTYLGSGKIEELRDRVSAVGATLVIFDDELSPTQGKNIEDAIGTRVMDRAELILDIFATRARTAESKMQVELAQLEYMLPRLTRMWTHLEKFRGGIGMRGPGETQLETDRRLISHRIKVLRDRMRDVQRGRAIRRQARRSEFRASLVGYTNAGKSSVLRALSGAGDILVENRLFATLDPLTRDVDLGENAHVLVTDTVGFIRKLPHHLVASFRATLEEAREADLLLHVIDASSPSWPEQEEVVNQVLSELEVSGRETLLVFNKVDLLDHESLIALQSRMREFDAPSVFVSALADGGLEPLRRALSSMIRAKRPMTSISLSPGDGKLIAEIHRQGEVLDQRMEGDRLVIKARIDAALAGRLERAGASVSNGKAPH